MENESSSDEAMIDEFLPLTNQTKSTSTMSVETQSDDDIQPADTCIGHLMTSLSQSTNHTDEGTVYVTCIVFIEFGLLCNAVHMVYKISFLA